MKHLKIAAATILLFFGAACSGASVSDEQSATELAAPEANEIKSASIDKVSSLGRYEGYSEQVYDEYVRSSVHVPMRDGVKVAIDIYRPAIDGVAVETPLPVILKYSRYLRARELPDGSIKGELGIIPPGKNGGKLELSLGATQFGEPYLVSHGYILARAESRGTGASFGIFETDLSDQEAEDAHDLIKWLSKQPFAVPKIGMTGVSYFGQTQYSMLRNAPPPELKALFPGVAHLDPYQSWLSGVGVDRKGIVTIWSINNERNDGKLDEKDKSASKSAKPSTPVARVDEDKDGKLLAAAVTERREARVDNDLLKTVFEDWGPKTEAIISRLKSTLDIDNDIDVIRTVYAPTDVLAKTLERHPELLEPMLYITRNCRDFFSEDPGNLQELIPAINESGVPIYNWGGWRDVYADATPLWYANLKTPKKLTMGPWSHSPKETDDPREDAYREMITVEQLRWFDYFLKDIDNGIMDEPEVHYAETYSPTEWQWREDDQWPPSGSKHEPFYFKDGRSGSISSVNDGLLAQVSPADESNHSFTVDYSTTMGTQDRHYDSIKGIFKSVDLVEHGKKGLTYTTPPLDKDLVVAGHPIVRLKASSSASDGDFMVYLEEVDADGSVHFLTDGMMRGSYRKLGKPSYNYLDLPWSIGTEDVVNASTPLNAGVASLDFPLKPIANRFEKGHRIRVVVTGADSDGTLLMPLNPSPTQMLSIGGVSPSLIELPILE